MATIIYLVVLVFGLFIVAFVMYQLYDLFSTYRKEYDKVNISQIIPRLYIGNINAAKELHILEDNKIDVVINCSTSIPFYHILNPKLKYYRIPVDDSLEDYDIQLMGDNLMNYVKIIDDELQKNKSVLVHCYAGRQRSASLVCAYLMYKYNYSIEQAYNTILDKREEAFHFGKHFNFHKSLLMFQDQLSQV